MPEYAAAVLDPLRTVVAEALATAAGLQPDDLMIVGAHCRDIIHTALGHRFVTPATRDLDLAIALRDWGSYQQIADSFPKVGSNGICYRIAGRPVDLLAFGAIEDPVGTVTPPHRGSPMSVWAFDEIYAAANQLRLSDEIAIRMPDIPGYAAAKLGAWLDRSEFHETKDARDIALALYWYAESPSVQDRLYESEDGIAALIAEDTDVPRAAARLLGQDIAKMIGALRLAELLARWPGNINLLVDNLKTSNNEAQTERRYELVRALSDGLTTT
ncbi:hypothetical protein [Nocardioides humilatus]|nr:hypothetical protein [Nocardioides humilatus]